MIKLGLHFMDEGQRSAAEYLNRIPSSTFKMVLDMDCLRDPAKVELLNLAHAKGMIVVGRRYGEGAPAQGAPVAAEVARYYGGIETQSYTELAQAFPQVDVWEGQNETVCTTANQMQWYADFCAALADMVYAQTGKCAGIGSWAVGNPDMALWKYWTPALEAVKQGKAVLTRHSYGPVEGEEGSWFALRHRRDQAEFTALGYPNMPVILTECGTDNIPNAATFNRPWKDIWGIDVGRYWGEYLKLLTTELELDSYVIGAHLFTCGAGGAPQWMAYDVSGLPLADAVLANPIGETPPPPPPPVEPPVVPPPDTPPDLPPVGDTSWLEKLMARATRITIDFKDGSTTVID